MIATWVASGVARRLWRRSWLERVQIATGLSGAPGTYDAALPTVSAIATFQKGRRYAVASSPEVWAPLVS
jgi:hypothetical protein